MTFDAILSRLGVKRRSVSTGEAGPRGPPPVLPFTAGEPIFGPFEIAHFLTLHALGALNVS